MNFIFKLGKLHNYDGSCQLSFLIGQLLETRTRSELLDKAKLSDSLVLRCIS